MIAIKNLRKDFGSVAAVDGISLEVRHGEILVLLGTSGCGKTTTLRMINRLLPPTSGTIWIDGRDTSREDPVILRRSIGYMIQGVGLFPHWTVGQNILTVPRLLGWGNTRCNARMEELVEMMDLPQELLNRRPDELSGGQRQRAGLARALAADPPIVLMDEPFGALDPVTRQQVRGEFRKVALRLKKTIVLVTHDVSEAIELGDRICLMSGGRIAQIGTPADLLFRPRSEFVRSFFASGRLPFEWMAVALEDLPLARRGGLIFGLPAELSVAEALSRLEETDQSAFLQVVGAFFSHKQALVGGKDLTRHD